MKIMFLINLINISVVFSNDTIKGYVFDAITKEPLSYVQIGMIRKKCGTISNDKGYFQLIVPGKLTSSDSIVFRLLSYKTLKITFNDIHQPIKIYLDKTSTNLPEVNIIPKKSKKIVLGNHRYNKHTNCFFSVNNSLQGTKKSGEAAIKANNKINREVWLEKFNFFLTENPMNDTLTFRLNFYALDISGIPGENINKIPIVFKVPPLKKGLVSVSLQHFNLSIKGDFFISVEVLSDFTDATQPTFSCSLMGPSYYRDNAFSDWLKMSVGGLDFNVECLYFK